MQAVHNITDKSPEHLESDVIIIGGGGAGLRAAVEAAKSGVKVTVINKGRVTASGATAVGIASHAGFAVPDGAADPEDTPDTFYEEVMEAAAGCADPRLVRTFANDATTAADQLEKIGVEFMKNPETGETLVNQGDYAHRARNRKIHGHGKSITVGLMRQLETDNVSFLEHTTVVDLIQDDNGISGVLCLNKSNQLITICGSVVILATGGAGQLFGNSLMPPDIMGDGYGLGLKAGARLANMEFVQCGFGLLSPVRCMIMPWTWFLDLQLLDANGNSVLEGFIPDGKTKSHLLRDKARHYPFSTIDSSMWIEIAAKKAWDEGRLKSGGVMDMDMTGVKHTDFEPGTIVAQMWPSTKEWFEKRRINVETDAISVALFGHAINGGLLISPDGETEVEGLFAVGEAAAGPYGADRLGGHMLLTTQVFGRRAGKRAAEVARERNSKKAHSSSAKMPKVDINSRFSDTGLTVEEVHTRIKQVMDRDVLIIRTEASLERAAKELHQISGEMAERGLTAKTDKELRKAFSLENLVLSGQALVAAASLRKETRGTHYREDYPDNDQSMAAPIFVSLEGGKLDSRFGNFQDLNW